MRTWRLLAEYAGVATTYEAAAGTAAPSPYTPDFTGRLIGLRAVVSRSTAASLINHVQFRLTSTTFNPNTIHAGAQGTGLQTAPVAPAPPMEWPVDQMVIAGNPVTIEARHITTDTPVTPRILLYGLFEVK